MAALFLLALILVVWQAVRTKPLRFPPYTSAWKAGEQQFPIAAPAFEASLALPGEPAARYRKLLDHAVLWPGPGGAGECSLFLRISAQTWAHLSLSPQRLERLLPEGTLPRGGSLRWAAPAFLDDDDGDGDRLDDRELTRSGPGAETEIFCPRPAAGEPVP